MTLNPYERPRKKVREFESKRISDVLPRLHISFIRLEVWTLTPPRQSNSSPPRVDHLPVLYPGKGEKKPVLPTSCQYGFPLSL